MENVGFTVTKDDRVNFYEYIERVYLEFGQRLTRTEMDVRTLQRDVDILKKRDYQYKDEGFFEDQLFSYSDWFRGNKGIELQIINRIYKPLAASTAIISGILAISIGVVVSPILALPFVLSTAFSSYYYHEQNRKGYH